MSTKTFFKKRANTAINVKMFRCAQRHLKRKFNSGINVNMFRGA